MDTKTKEELKDLEQEVEDAQSDFDNDWYNLITTVNFITKSYENLQTWKMKLEIFKKENNIN